jgi:hypothetical protein
MSPIRVLKRELLPDPIGPIMQTNSPFFTEKLRFLRMNSCFTSGASAVASSVPSVGFSSLSFLKSSSFLAFLSFFDFFFGSSSFGFSKPQWKLELSLSSKAD